MNQEMDIIQTCIHCLEKEVGSLLDFCDINLNFKVTPALVNSNFDQSCVSSSFLRKEGWISALQNKMVTRPKNRNIYE